ncbi:MAG: hypothetical protein ABID38_01495 [Candidatus Diapherotrites archaeon]
MNLGIEVKKSTNKEVEIERKTQESEVRVVIGKDSEIDTSLNFLNHMIETISFRSGIPIGISFKGSGPVLEHVIAEDSGIAIGRAMLELFKNRIKIGVNGSGYSIQVIDEAMAVAAISIEGRANCFINRNCNGANKEIVEDMKADDLVAFLDGLSQGMKSTIRINIEQGIDAHHTWEAGFRALGEAIGLALRKNESRKGMIAGLKGTLE